MVLFRVAPLLRIALFFGIIVYACAQYLTGSGSIFSKEIRIQELAAKEQILTDLKAERADLESRAIHLADGNVSKDLLEERARLLLGFSLPQAYVIREPLRPATNS